jgi:hypothetical protein
MCGTQPGLVFVCFRKRNCVLKVDKILNVARWMHATGCDCLKLRQCTYGHYNFRATFDVSLILSSWLTVACI